MNASQIIQLLLAILNNLPELESDGADLVSALKSIFSSSTPPTGADLLALLQQAQTTDAQIETAQPVLVPPITNPQGASEGAEGGAGDGGGASDAPAAAPAATATGSEAPLD